MRKVIGVTALLLALVCHAHAGEMQNGIAPPNQPTNVTQERPTGDETPDESTQDEAPDGMTQAVLDVLTVLSSLL